MWVCVCVWFCAYALSGCISNVRNARGHSWVFLMRLSIYHYSNEFKGEWFIVCVCACVILRKCTIDIIITIITINDKVFINWVSCIYVFDGCVCALWQWICQVSETLCRCASLQLELEDPFCKQQQKRQTMDDSASACVWFISDKNPSVHMCIQTPSNAKHTCTILPLLLLVGGRQQKSSLQAPLLLLLLLLTSPLPLSSSHYHIGQGLLIVPRQRAENGERKGIMTVRREKRGSERKEGQTGYYEGEGWEQWRHLESLFAFLSHGLRSQSDWSIRPAM